MITPELHLNTLFVLNDEGRITSTREPGGSRGPLFSLVRNMDSCAWAVRADIPQDLTRELDNLARQEPAVVDLRNAPVYAERYVAIFAGRIRSSQPAKIHQSAGPAFSFPELVQTSDDIVVVEDEQVLGHNFRGWIPGEIAAGRSPVFAVVKQGHPVSICFCARRSDVAAEAGVETAEEFRGRGFGTRVAAAWALAVRNSGRIPLYSTSWSNHASLGIARKLGLIPYASDWSLSD